MVNIQCPTAEIRRGNKKRRRKNKKPQDENIYVRILLCRAAINEHTESRMRKAKKQLHNCP